jgi:prephenate dehydrogenase
MLIVCQGVDPALPHALSKLKGKQVASKNKTNWWEAAVYEFMDCTSCLLMLTRILGNSWKICAMITSQMAYQNIKSLCAGL